MNDEITGMPKALMLRLVEAVERIADVVESGQGFEKKTTHKRSGAVPKKRHEYEREFEDFWTVYPARSGSNPKWKAQQCWRARMREANAQGNSTNAERVKMQSGVERYSKWCEATGKTGTELVMQATRFVGPGKEYENEWTPPSPELQIIKLPPDGDRLVQFGIKHGVKPKAGESWFELRQRIERTIENNTESVSGL